MSLFARITKGDIDEIRHGLEILERRVERLQKTARSGSATAAGLSRRIKAIEALIQNAPVETDHLEVEDVDDVEDVVQDVSRETFADRETQRVALRREYGQ